MSTTARPALSKALHCFKHNWRDVLFLASKTYIFAYLVEFVIRSVSDKIIGTEFLEQWKQSFIQNLNLFSRYHMPVNEIATNPIQDTLLLIINTAFSAWLTAPLVISLSRTVILSETFDTSFFARLTDHRCLKIALVSLIPSVLVFSSFAYESSSATTIFIEVAFVIYIIFALYIMARTSYLIPIIAIDYPLSTPRQAWIITQGKAWSVFKVLFMIILLYFVLLFLIGILFHHMSSILDKLTQLILFGIFQESLLILLLGIIFSAAIASIYKQSQK